MKKIIVAILAIILVLSFSACEGEKTPEGSVLDEVKDLTPSAPVNKEVYDLYEEIILGFGAVKEDGKILTDKSTSLFYVDDFENGAELDEYVYFGWAVFYFNNNYDYETRKEIFTYPFGEGSGWAYPSEYYEPVMEQYFGVSAEKLRSGELYVPEHDCYWIGGGGGLGLRYEITLISAETNGDFLSLNLELYEPIYEVMDKKVLTVRLNPDGTYQYISYLPYRPSGENAELSTADRALCEKIISDFGASHISNGIFNTPKGQPTAFDCGYFSDASAAPVETYFYWLFHFSETSGKIESCPFDEKNGSAFSAELLEDYAIRYFGANINHLHFSDLYSADENVYKCEAQNMHFGTPTEILSFERENNILTIHIRQTVHDGERIRRSVITAKTLKDGSYRILSYLPEDYDFYKEILLNFGGEKNKNGDLRVAKGVSLYYSDGYEDFSNIGEGTAHSFVMFHSYSENYAEVALPGFREKVYAFPEDYFEAIMLGYFDTTTEYLHGYESYYPEQHCYFMDGHAGIGETPNLLIKSAEETGDTVIFHLTIDYNIHDDYNMALTVRIDSDGSYKYLSYLPE